MADPAPPPTRVLSWLQEVLTKDPNRNQEYQRPWWFEFSNGRQFLWRPDIYTTEGP